VEFFPEKMYEKSAPNEFVKKIAQNDGETIFCPDEYFLHGKSGPKILVTTVIKNCPKKKIA
jgi:hypothetical protein